MLTHNEQQTTEGDAPRTKTAPADAGFPTRHLAKKVWRHEPGPSPQKCQQRVGKRHGWERGWDPSTLRPTSRRFDGHEAATHSAAKGRKDRSLGTLSVKDFKWMALGAKHPSNLGTPGGQLGWGPERCGHTAAACEARAGCGRNLSSGHFGAGFRSPEPAGAHPTLPAPDLGPLHKRQPIMWLMAGAFFEP